MSEQVVVFATNKATVLALISSNIHFAWWTTKGESSLRADARYTPSDGFETFPQPELTERMGRVGEELDSYRRSVMLGRELGLTKLYNLVHDEQTTSADIRRLRDLHVEVDESVAEAYGWSDLRLGHGFHSTRQGTRFTIDPNAQVEMLDRLLELNHKQHRKDPSGAHGRGPRKQARMIVPPITIQAPATEPLSTPETLF